MTSDLLKGLNDQQVAAITVPAGATLVIAGPGSGKTAVLTRRVAYLIREMGVMPSQIMAVTFTNKAAREMQERIERLLGQQKLGIAIGTFHALCSRMLRREAKHLGIHSDFVIFDGDDQLALMKQVLVQLNIDAEKGQARGFLYSISNAKNELISPNEYPTGSYQERQTAEVYKSYQMALSQSNALDFDDLLVKAVELFRDHPSVRQHYQAMFTHILVDEFQDTNTAQYKLVRLLAGDTGSLFCVGDPDQSIYRFRGADYRNLQLFMKDYPQARQILLENNYRSHQVILNAAMAVIDKNTDRVRKQLQAQRSDGAKLTLKQLSDDDDEARYVTWTLRDLVQTGKYSYKDCAIMYRTNAQSRAIEDMAVRSNIPYRLVGGVRFYGRREIKDLLAYLRVIHNPLDSVSLLRIINTPARGIGKTTLDKLNQFALSRNQSLYDALGAFASGIDAKITGKAASALKEFYGLIENWRTTRDTLPVGTLLKSVMSEIDYLNALNDGTPEGKERIENVLELYKNAEAQGERTLGAYLEEISLVADVDSVNEDENSAVFLTLHAAKGLEFPVVFIIGNEEGLLPHTNALENEEELAEERRLMYVGLTRAKDLVYLTWVTRRMGYGGSMGERAVVSRFLRDIPPELTTGSIVPKHGGDLTARAGTWESPSPHRPTWTPPVPRPLTSTSTANKPLPGRGINLTSLYRSGQKVMHETFGEGVIIASRLSGGDEILDIKFPKHGVKRLLAGLAPMRLIDDE
ncbi:MAG: UvrD-helicase domain-containing protein [Anaerolineae bacterium]